MFMVHFKVGSSVFIVSCCKLVTKAFILTIFCSAVKIIFASSEKAITFEVCSQTATLADLLMLCSVIDVTRNSWTL